jgi:hypothetical protein
MGQSHIEARTSAIPKHSSGSLKAETPNCLNSGREKRQGQLTAPRSDSSRGILVRKAVTAALISVFHIYRPDPWEFLTDDSN